MSMRISDIPERVLFVIALVVAAIAIVIGVLVAIIISLVEKSADIIITRVRRYRCRHK